VFFSKNSRDYLFSRLQTVELRRFLEFLSSLMINVIILSLISLMC